MPPYPDESAPPEAAASAPTAARPAPVRTAILLTVAIAACSLYANLPFALTDPAAYRFFPPFKRHVNAAETNRDLGIEYLNIARSLTQGRGFADLYGQQTGPTAWMPPFLSTFQAGLLWLCQGSRTAVTVVVVVFQVGVLIGTGLLVLALVRQTTRRIAPGTAAAVFLVALLADFHQSFQSTHDCWLVLLAVDLLIAGLCWWRPFEQRRRAATWGVLGGLFALINPIVGLAWAVLSSLAVRRRQAWTRLALAALAAALVLTPWTVRNYRVFGRFIPVKSNLAYELYQSQCLQPDGLMQTSHLDLHPFSPNNTEGREFRQLGETAFLARKSQQFWQSVRANPGELLHRVASRFVGATVRYVPLQRTTEPKKRPWVFWFNRLTFPLPFLGLLVLAVTARRHPLHPAQWTVIGVYLLYLTPYVCVSYYERYAFPLLAVKVLLVLWAADRLLARIRGHLKHGHSFRPLLTSV